MNMDLTCPRCASKDVRRSRQTGLLALVLKQFSLDPFRCRNCRKKFYRSASLETRRDIAGPAPKLATLPVSDFRLETQPSMRKAVRYRQDLWRSELMEQPSYRAPARMVANSL